MKKFTLILLTITLGFIVYDIKQLDNRFEKVAAKCLPMTVTIKVFYNIPDFYTGKLESVEISGAGIFISPIGHILTCAHLFTFPFNRSKIVTVELYSNTTVAGEILAISNKSDLALIRTPAITGNNYIQLADPRKIKVGQEVIAIGNALGLDFTVTHGIISALYRDLEESYNVIQSDVFINPGNSGGPVINLQGELVGINSFMISPVTFFPIFTGLGFSVPSGQCLEFLISNGKSIPVFRRHKWLKILNKIKNFKLMSIKN